MGRAVVGRTGDNDLQIRSRFVSRHHIQINTDGEKTTVEDLNSTNGMLIDGKRTQYRVMHDGDVIQLGEHKLVYRDFRDEADDQEHTSPHEDHDGIEHDETYTPGDSEELAEAAEAVAESEDDADVDAAENESEDEDAAELADDDPMDELEEDEEFDSVKTRVLE